MDFERIDPYKFAVSMVALILCVAIHEFSHAFSAWKAGDDTPKLQGRISINPLDHLDPIGTIMMVVSSLSGFGIGWGKPVQVNPFNFRSPRWDNLRVSLWGPLSNLITAAITGTAYRFMDIAIRHDSIKMTQFTANSLDFIWMLTVISISLAMFNLIPITPLDGSHILSALLPTELARKYDYFSARYGMFVFLGLIFLGGSLLSDILSPPIGFFLRLFTG